MKYTEKAKVILEDYLTALNLNLLSSQVDKLMDYYELTYKWQQKINITKNTSPRDFVRENIIDIILACQKLSKEILELKSIIDVGCGGGFGGIVFKILAPSLNIVLIDSDRKKISFCKQVIRELNLDNIQATQTRVQDYSIQTPFNVIMTRATFSDPKDCYVACQQLAQGVSKVVMFRSATHLEEDAKLGKVLEYEIGPNGIKRGLLVM